MSRISSSSVPSSGPGLTTFDTEPCVYEPLFQSATGLASASGLAVASGGGLIAAVGGTSGSGILNLPSILDNTKPWRFAVLFEWNGDTTRTASVILRPATSVANYTWYGLGLSATNGANQTCSTVIGASASLYQSLSMTAGQKYWYTACSDGTTVFTALVPYNHAGISNFVSNVALGYAFEVGRNAAANLVANSVSVFTNLSQVVITNASATTKILGVYVQPGALNGAPDPRCQPPATLSPTINGDSDTSIRIPRAYTGRTATDIILVGHPNGSDIGRGIGSTEADTGAAVASLVNAGYIVASILGDPSLGYTSATASDWGAPAGLVYRKKLLEWIRANLSNTRNVYWLGHSMGCMTGLMFHATYPGILRGLIGVSGVTNLSDSYSNRGFGATINTAYGVSSLASVTDRDPNLRPGLYTGLPMLLYHGDADTVIPAAQNGAAFATAVNALGGNVTYVSVAGAGHLNAAGLWDGPAMLNFLARN